MKVRLVGYFEPTLAQRVRNASMSGAAPSSPLNPNGRVKESRIEDEEAAEDLAAEHHTDACRVGRGRHRARL
jgi:hypothetical protein